MLVLTREEKKNLSFHLNFALCIIFVFGILIGIVGFLYSKPILVVIGSLTSMVPVFYLMVLTCQEQVKIAKKIKDVTLKEISTFKAEILQAELFLESFTLEGGIEHTTSTRKDSINHISLIRLVEMLKIRINEIEPKLNSNSVTAIEQTIADFNLPLCFPPQSSKVLIDHKMPDIPKSSWLDSLHFLIKDLKQITH